MENFTLLSEVVTPEVAVLLRAALIGALIFGLEALSNAKRRGERREVRREKRVKRSLSKKQIVRT